MFEPGNGFDPIQHGHRDINDQNVRIQGFGGFEERGTVTNHSNHVEVRREDPGDAFAYLFVIFG